MIQKNQNHILELILDQGHVPVSYISSLLRTLQAAIREVAVSSENTRSYFDKQPQPTLVLISIVSDEQISMCLGFEDPINKTILPTLSENTFSTFLDKLSEFVMSLPQPSLWGGAARKSSTNPESEMSNRMDQVYAELRRAKKVNLKFKTRSIEIEGDRFEIF